MKLMSLYLKNNRKLILLTTFLIIGCYSALIFCANVRIDTEVLINHPGTTMGWETIGRFGTIFLKRILGLSTYRVVWSGILFLLFFWAQTQLVLFYFYIISLKNQIQYPLWAFSVLYVTSAIWFYMFYFSLMHAEVACGLLLSAISCGLFLHGMDFFETGSAGVRRLFCVLLSVPVLVLALASYQAITCYYITLCAVLFLLRLDRITQNGSLSNASFMRFFRSGLLCVLQFFVSYMIYRMIVNKWFFTGDYLSNMRQWGVAPALACLIEIAQQICKLLIAYYPTVFSFYPIGFVCLIFLWFACRKKTGHLKIIQKYTYYLIWCVVLAAPLMIAVYLGNGIVGRMQMSLQMTAAFIAMMCLQKCHACLPGRKMQAQIVTGCIVAICIIQVITCARLIVTDYMREAQDSAFSDVLTARLQEAADGSIPDLPVIFVGKHEDQGAFPYLKKDIFGYGFYEFDYDPDHPECVTYRAAGYLQAKKGITLKTTTDPALLAEALAESETMQDFPAENSIKTTNQYVIVRLSGQSEKIDTFTHLD